MQCHIIQSSPAVLITLISHTNGQGAVGDFDTGDGGILPVGIGGEHKRHCQLLAVYDSIQLHGSIRCQVTALRESGQFISTGFQICEALLNGKVHIGGTGPEVESHLTAVGIGSFDLIVGGIRFTGVCYSPHRSISILKAGILYIIAPFYRDNGSNFRTFIQRSGNCERSAVFRVDGGNIFSILGDRNLFFGTIVIDDTYGIRKLDFRTDIAGHHYFGDGVYRQRSSGSVLQIFKYI